MRKRYRLSYFIGTGASSFIRNGFMSFSAIVILVCALIICAAFILLTINIDYNVSQIDDFNKVVVFAKLSATDDEVKQIKSEIDKLPQVSSSELVPREVSIISERNRYGEEFAHLFERYVENESENPLPDVINVEYNDINEVDMLVYSLERLEGVDKVKNRKDIADNINKVKSVILIVCTILTVALLIVSLLIISNTIKLTMNHRKKEITIMRYIGATNTFITLPFIFEAVITAILSTLFSYLITVYSYKYITEFIVADYGTIDTIPVGELKLYILACFAVVSFVLCIFGTIFSTRRYLKA